MLNLDKYWALTDRADEADVEQILEEIGQEQDDTMRGHYRVLLRLVMAKNPEMIDEIRRDETMTYEELDNKLMEMLKDKVDAKVNAAVDAKINAAVNAAVSEAVSAAEIAKERETTVTYINDIMRKLKYTPAQAMDLLSIPQSQRSTYAGLVGGRAQ